MSFDSGNPFQSPRPTDDTSAPVGTAGSGGSRLGEILSRAFNGYFRQWGDWPVPVLICALIAIGSYLACVLPFLFAQGPLMCALFACAFRNLRGWPVDTSALGRGWQVAGSAMVSAIALMLIQVIPMLLIFAIVIGGMTLLGVSVVPKQPGAKPDDAAIMAFMFSTMAAWMLTAFVMMGWGFYFSTRTMFIFPLIADRGYGFSTAWHASWDATRRRFWERLLLVVLAGIVGNLGVYICYVGVIFTIPLYFMIIAAAYEDEFGIAFDGWQIPAAIDVAAADSPFQAGGDVAR
jgi:hypothetical protein